MHSLNVIIQGSDCCSHFGALRMILKIDGDTSTSVLLVHNTLMNVISRLRGSKSEKGTVLDVVQGSESGHNRMISDAIV